MTESLTITVDRLDGLAVIHTQGYIDNQGGEEIASAAYRLIGEDYRVLLLDLAGTSIVNSIGISILIEVLEKVMDKKGALAFCGLTPTIDKTFRIMGLAQYAEIFPSQEDALRSVSKPQTA